MSAARYGASLIAGKAVYGITEIGTRGDAIPSGGTSGPGFVYPSLNLPADAAKKYRGQIIAWPSAGSLFAYEDTSFLFSGAPDGVYTFTFRLWEDGVDKGTAVITLQVGAVAGVTFTAAAALLTGSATGGALAAGQTMTATTSMLSGSASGSSGATAAGAMLTAAASILAGAASAGGSATAPGQILAVAAQLVAGAASGQVNGTAGGFLAAAAASMIPGAAVAGTVAPGALLATSSSILPGSASGLADALAAGALLTVGANILGGGAFGPIFAATPGYAARLRPRSRRYSAKR